MKYEIELPNEMLKDGVAYEPTGEFRNPKKGEAILWLRSVTITGRDFDESEPYIILRPKWVWPEWLGGWGFTKQLGRVSWLSGPALIEGTTWRTYGDCEIVSADTLAMIYPGFVAPRIDDLKQPIINPNWNKEDPGASKLG